MLGIGRFQGRSKPTNPSHGHRNWGLRDRGWLFAAVDRPERSTLFVGERRAGEEREERLLQRKNARLTA